jgi:hypothetical protein
MMFGDPRQFALESKMSRAYERPGLRGLGFFLIHLGSLSYGVRDVEATFLACSFDEVGARIQSRGSHTAPFSGEDAGSLADAVGLAIYAEHGTHSFFGNSREEFRDLLYAKRVVWAPDGDQAFDDGSTVLHFDANDRVRLIGFRRGPDQRHEPATLRDVWLGSDNFYRILGEWRGSVEADWVAATKVPE